MTILNFSLLLIIVILYPIFVARIVNEMTKIEKHNNLI